MRGIWILGMVLSTGILFTLGDIFARKWGQDRTSVTYFLLMASVSTMGYGVFGTLVQDAEFSRAAIWTSIVLTTLSCLYGLYYLGEPATVSKIAAATLALAAAYLSTR